MRETRNMFKDLRKFLKTNRSESKDELERNTEIESTAFGDINL
jgi:hypothetical protein